MFSCSPAGSLRDRCLAGVVSCSAQELSRLGTYPNLRRWRRSQKEGTTAIEACATSCYSAVIPPGNHRPDLGSLTKSEGEALGGVAAPVGNFSQSVSNGVFEEANPVTGMLELMDVGPDFRLPGSFVRGRLSAACAAGVQPDGRVGLLRTFGQFDEDATHFLDFFVWADQVGVT